MGIDVYLHWKKQSKKDAKKQITGWKIDKGDVGYLREAYHGGPYATRVLAPEGWDDKIDQGEYGVPIPAATLRERLPAVVLTAIYRNHIVYEQGHDPSEVHIADDKEAAAGDILTLVKGTFAKMSDGKEEAAIARAPSPEQIRAAQELIAKRALPDYALAFVDFVDLAEKHEKRTGEPCGVYVSA